MKKSLDEEEDVFINFVKKFDPEVRGGMFGSALN